MFGDKRLTEAAESSAHAADLLRLARRDATVEQVASIVSLAAVAHELHAITLTLEVIADVQRRSLPRHEDDQ